MEALGINLKFLLIQLANFGLFVFLFTKFLLKPILKMLDARKKKIADGLEAAEKSKTEFLKIDELKNEAKRKMKSEEKKLLDEARIKAEKQASVIIADAKKQSEKITKETTQNIKNIEKEATLKMRENELHIIEKIIDKILDQKMDSVQVKTRYQKVMSELYQNA